MSLRVYRWRDAPVMALAFTSFAAGFGSFGAVSALGEVARTFGQHVHGTASIAEQAGLSGTQLGIGLAILRLASLAAMPIAGLADRFGRRRLLIASTAGGLLLTVLAAASPGYWWFVAAFALGRPGLSAANAISQVSAAEQTATAQRAKAIAVVAAGYGVGSGVIAGINGLAKHSLGFRGLFLLTLIPLALLPLLRRALIESDRYMVAGPSEPILGAVAPEHRRRLAVVAVVTFSIGLLTGPINSFVFVYAENVRHVSGPATTLMVLLAGVTGLAGLLAGRSLADRWGRRPTAGVAMVAMAGFGVLTYSGTRAGLIGGYVAGILVAAAFAPAAGAIANELFPTSVRASVSGFLTVAGVLGATVGLLGFGAIADVADRFLVASLAVAPVPVLGALLLLALPETKGMELDTELAAPLATAGGLPG